MLADPITLARYNAWANARLHAACATLPHAELVKPRKAFFGTILGTLNHVLLVDILYRDRLEKNPVRFQSLRETLHPELPPLTADQQSQDAWYIHQMATMDRTDSPSPFRSTPCPTTNTGLCRCRYAWVIYSSTRSIIAARPTTCCPRRTSTHPRWTT